MPIVQLSCQQCGKSFSRPSSHIKERSFCSKPCAYAGIRKPDNTSRRMVFCPGHPLAGKNGYLSEHRKVLYEVIGDGPHRCHWCQAPVVWVKKAGRGTVRGSLVADHLDNNPLNNARENLVAACVGCNGTRWHKVHDHELFITRKSGTRLRAEKRTCNWCGKEFLFAPSISKRPGAGKYCSRDCHYHR